MQVTFSIQRFDPTKDSKPYRKEYTIEVEPTARILDCLDKIKWEIDGSLAYRRSCSHGICGSDAMMINGINKLACQVLVQDYKKKYITIDPLPSLPIIKDLIVNMDSFFKKYEVVKPYLITKTPPPKKERYQSQEDRALIDEAVNCILCGACSTSCPSLWSNDDYLGPAALLKAYRFAFDSRDEAQNERLDAIDTPDGLWRCRTIFNCVEVCPKEINITWHLSQLKKRCALREL
ncbi:MAG TPA: succinate dehydrogenase iron-sulfur subunit [Bacteroidota bacterium]|jgi:succinate dehydrogenase / fumarate reductase iron-sulfur subunit|nr:succinate dehydrogenase iron-sulfur subunit [Bacteroidota bacterium]